MNRPYVTFPISNKEWDNLPNEFKLFIDQVDEVRNQMEEREMKYTYPSYDYSWNVDSDIPLQTLIHLWNSDESISDIKELVKDISTGLAEEAFMDYYASSYSA
jgi:hypothetical protein